VAGCPGTAASLAHGALPGRILSLQLDQFLGQITDLPKPLGQREGGSDGGMLRANRPRGKEWTIRISARLEHESRLG
jgi:hypothetical protein